MKKKLIVNNLKEFFDLCSENPFKVLARLEEEVFKMEDFQELLIIDSGGLNNFIFEFTEAKKDNNMLLCYYELKNTAA